MNLENLLYIPHLIARSFGGDEDLEEEGRLALLEAVSTHDPKLSSIKTHCYRVIRCRMIDFLRKQNGSRRKNKTKTEQGTDFVDKHSEEVKKFFDLTDGLSDEMRKILFFHYVDGEELKSIARRLGLNYFKVLRLHVSAKKILKG